MPVPPSAPSVRLRTRPSTTTARVCLQHHHCRLSPTMGPLRRLSRTLPTCHSNRLSFPSRPAWTVWINKPSIFRLELLHTTSRKTKRRPRYSYQDRLPSQEFSTGVYLLTQCKECLYLSPSAYSVLFPLSTH